MYVYKCIFFYIFPSIRLVSKLDAGKWRTITFVFDFRSEFCALSPDKDRIVISSNDRARMRVWRRFMRFCENIVTEMCYRLIHCCNEVRDSGFLSAPPRALRPVPHNAGRSARSCRRAARVTLTDGNPWRAVTVEKVVISRTANAHSRVRGPGYCLESLDPVPRLEQLLLKVGLNINITSKHFGPTFLRNGSSFCRIVFEKNSFKSVITLFFSHTYLFWLP